MPNYRYQMSGQMRQNGCVRQNPRHMPGMTGPSRNGDGSVLADGSCGENTGHDELKDMAVAMAYVPWQNWKSLYKPERGLQRGTIFEELDKPFRGIGGCCNGRA